MVLARYSQVCILLSKSAFVLHDHVVHSPAYLRGGFECQGPVRTIDVYSVQKLALEDQKADVTMVW
jgi:hypothetical protein